MIRLTLALATWMSLASAVSGSLTPRKEFAAVSREVWQVGTSKRSAPAMAQEAGQGAKSEFVVTERTEILLNGKPCRYEEVPQDAWVVRMEVAADKKTVLKIHFRVRK